MKWRQIIAIGLTLLGVAGCAAKTNELEVENSAVKLSAETQKGHYRLVTTQQLKAWLDEGKSMLIVDTMPYAESYQKQHIPGAVQLEFPIAEVNEVDEQTKIRLQSLLDNDKGRLIVFYCGFTKCGRSHNGAMTAVKLGYTNVYRFPGGINAWREAGYPVETAETSAKTSSAACASGC